MARTQEQRRTETRTLLLNAAADLFARKGFHATSAEAVAAAADRTTGALYDHFGGKEGLLVGLLELWIGQTVVDLTASLEGERDLDGRLGALWSGVIRRDSESGDAWLLLEFELWLHAVRDPEVGIVGAERFDVIRAGLAGGFEDWAREFDFALPAPSDEVAAQVIALLLGAAFQYRLDPAAVPQPVVVAGLRRLLDLPAVAPAPPYDINSPRSSAMTDLQIPIDLLEDTWAQGVPHDQFQWLRANDPVHWHEHPEWQGFWVVTRYDDVRSVSRDHQTYSTELGSTFLQDHEPEALELIRMTLLNMDPPKHSRYRRLVSAGFTPRMIGRLIDHIGDQAAGIIASIEGRDEVEFVEEVAAELPLQVICEMIGVPNEDRHMVFDWSNRLVGFQDEDFRTSEEDGQIAAAEIYAYCDAIVADRLASPRDDIMTALVNAEVDGDRLSKEELNMFFVLLCVAGNETTRNLIAHSLQVLLEHPEIKADLVANIDDDDLWNSATEEFLRWGAAIHNFRRTATTDTEIAGQAIAAGDKVVIYYSAANRDPDHFADPEVFDPRRTGNDHLTFGGGGAHFCLGANLARAEIKVMIREFLRRFPDVTAAGPHRRMRSDFVNGIKYLPVRLNG